LGARGFATEADARDFGEQLRLMVGIAGLCSRLGVDVGEDRPSGWVSEDFARSIGLVKPHERMVPNVHGLTILPDDDNTRVAVTEVQAEVRSDPSQLLGAMTELAREMPLRVSAAASGVRLLNVALMSSQPLAQIVLAFSAVEALGQDETWSAAQADLIKKLAADVEENDGKHDAERLEVAEALRRSLHRVGLRQGVLRVLSRLDLRQLAKEWDRLYSLRSGVFHGTRVLTETEIAQLANDTVSLCGRIILAVVEQDGITVPSVAAKHFGERDVRE